MQTSNYILEYFQDIKDGSVAVGHWIRLLYEYIVRGLDEKRFSFDQRKANAAIEWIETHCFHTKGRLAPGPLKLELWQKALLSCVFGIVENDTGFRQFREVVLIVARKNGKSALMSAICNMMLRSPEFSDYGGEIYTIAPKLDQAAIVYDATWQMIQSDPEQIAMKEALESARSETHTKVEPDAEMVRKRISDLYLPATNSFIKKLPFTSKRSDGYSPVLTVLDEIAAWEGDKALKQYEVMQSATGARDEPLLISCSTAGYVSDSIYDELMKRSTQFLLGSSKETRLLPFLYIIDDPERWDDISELAKSNPNLGVSIKTEFLLDEIVKARHSLSKKNEVLCKYANVKQNSALAWLSAKTVEKACGEHFGPEDLADTYATIGIDLSQTTDLTAATCVVEKAGELYVLAHFWLPSEKLDEAAARDGLPYRAYIERGLLSPSGENIIDYHDVYEWIVGLVEQYQILPLCVGYDRYSSQYLCGRNGELARYGFKLDDVWQGENLYGTMMTVEAMIEDGHLHIGDNDLMKAHFLDSAVKMSAERGRGRLVKVRPICHIDGMAALLDAMVVREKWSGEIGEQLKNLG